jgi:CTP synthase
LITSLVQLICRSATEMPESAQEKISMFSHVDKEQVISLPDVNNIYKVPLILNEHGLDNWFIERLSLKDVPVKCTPNSSNLDVSIMDQWAELAERFT